MKGYNNSGWYWQRKKKTPDFVASSSYIIKFNSGEQIERLMSQLTDKGTQNMYISSTSHSKMEEFKKQVKTEALQAAKAKATYLCEAKAKATYLCEGIGEKVGKVLLIKEVEGTSYAEPMMMKSRMMEASMADSNFEPSGLEFQKITIQMQILAQFAIQ